MIPMRIAIHRVKKIIQKIVKKNFSEKKLRFILMFWKIVKKNVFLKLEFFMEKMNIILMIAIQII